jgi:hypothetical protein
MFASNFRKNNNILTYLAAKIRWRQCLIMYLYSSETHYLTKYIHYIYLFIFFMFLK